MILNSINFETSAIPMQKFYISLASIIKISLPTIILVIGLPVILIIGYINKSKK